MIPKSNFLRQFRIFYLIAIKSISRNKIPVVFVLIAALAIIALLWQAILFTPKTAITEGFIGTFQEHDLPIEVTKLLSQSLVDSDKGGNFKPGLVEGWETNNDATIYKFKFKDNLKWADGSSLKSSDIEFSIPDVEVSYPDDKTIEFKLKESYSPFPSLLAKPVFKKGTLLGIGPYKVEKIEKSRIFITKLTLKPLDNNLPTLDIRFYPNEKTGHAGFEIGEVQALLGVTNPDYFKSNPQVEVSQKTDYGKIVTVLFYTKDPLLSNRSIRQALSYGIPEIDNQIKSENPFSPFSWAFDPSVKKYDFNAKSAQAAIERAKTSGVSEEFLKKELILTSTPNLEGVGKKIIESWKSLGFDAKLRVESGVPQNFSALLITQSIPHDPDQYFLWHSTQEKTNLTKYSKECCSQSPRVDKDLEDGRRALTQEDRKASYVDFQKTLLEDAPAAYLYFPKYNIVYLRKVKTDLNKIINSQLGTQIE